MQVDFYQLGQTPLERVLPRIAERVLEGGGRLLVVADDGALLGRLDEQLWSYSAVSFLPHGQAGQAGDADQPVLLSTAIEPINGARHVALADGVWRDAALAFERAFLLFGGETVAGARMAWRALAKRDDLVRNLWQQDGAGKWKRTA